MEEFERIILEEQLKILKERYDKAFAKYWTARNNPPKFGPITMKEFKERLKNPEFFEKYGRLKSDTEVKWKFDQTKDQEMLTKMMNETQEHGSIHSEEVAKWWINRY